MKIAALLTVFLIALGAHGRSNLPSSQADFQIVVAATTDTGGFELRTRSTDGSTTSVLGQLTQSLGATVSSNGAKLAQLDNAQPSPLSVSNIDGSDAHFVGAPGEPALDPALSPDGSLVVFQTAITGPIVTEQFIGIANSDGSDFRLLTTQPDIPFQPQFDPTGSKVIFVSQIPTTTVQIINVDGTGQRLLYSATDVNTNYPTLSPDGKHLAFTSNFELWVANLKSGTKRKIAEDVRNGTRPYFSPDGKWIIYTALQGPGGGPLTHPTIVRVNGTGAIALPVTNGERVAGVIPE